MSRSNLEPDPTPPSTAPTSTEETPGVTDDVWPLLRDALSDYSALISELDAGTIDDAAFSRRALKVGLIVRPSDAWILDLAGERWWRYDGVSLTTVALESVETAETGE